MTIDLTEDERALLIFSLGAAAGVFMRDGMKESAERVWKLAGKLEDLNHTPEPAERSRKKSQVR